jgi:hypothetical protein
VRLLVLHMNFFRACAARRLADLREKSSASVAIYASTFEPARRCAAHEITLNGSET